MPLSSCTYHRSFPCLQDQVRGLSTPSHGSYLTIVPLPRGDTQDCPPPWEAVVAILAHVRKDRTEPITKIELRWDFTLVRLRSQSNQGLVLSKFVDGGASWVSIMIPGHCCKWQDTVHMAVAS